MRSSCSFCNAPISFSNPNYYVLTWIVTFGLNELRNGSRMTAYICNHAHLHLVSVSVIIQYFHGYRTTQPVARRSNPFGIFVVVLRNHIPLHDEVTTEGHGRLGNRPSSEYDRV